MEFVLLMSNKGEVDQERPVLADVEIIAFIIWIIDIMFCTPFWGLKDELSQWNTENCKNVATGKHFKNGKSIHLHFMLFNIKFVDQSMS